MLIHSILCIFSSLFTPNSHSSTVQEKAIFNLEIMEKGGGKFSEAFHLAGNDLLHVRWESSHNVRYHQFKVKVPTFKFLYVDTTDDGL